MPPEELVAISTDDRVILEASSLWHLIRGLKRARKGRYLIFRVRVSARGPFEYPANESVPHGMAIVDDNWVDVREHGPDKQLKRRILIENPRRPRSQAMATVE